MSRVDAGYVAYLTRENAWLRARATDLSVRLEGALLLIDDLRLEVTALRAIVLEYRQRGTLPAREVNET